MPRGRKRRRLNSTQILTEVLLTDTDSEVVCQEGTPNFNLNSAREQLVCSPIEINVAESQNENHSGGSFSIINPIIPRRSDSSEIDSEQSVLSNISNIMCDSLNMVIYKGNSHNSSNSTVLILSRNGSDDNLCINTHDEPIYYDLPVENTISMHIQEESQPVLISFIQNPNNTCPEGSLSFQKTSANAFCVPELRETYVSPEQLVYTNLDSNTRKDTMTLISGKDVMAPELVHSGENIFFPQTSLNNSLSQDISFVNIEIQAEIHQQPTSTPRANKNKSDETDRPIRSSNQIINNSISLISDIDLIQNPDNTVIFDENRCSHVFSAIEEQLRSGNTIEVSRDTNHSSIDVSNVGNGPVSNNLMLVDRDYISVANSSTSTTNETVALSNNSGRPKRGRKRKHESQNRKEKKKKLNKGLQYINVKGKVIEAKIFQGTYFNCRCKNKCTEKLSVEARKSIFEIYWSAGSYEARCALLQSYCKEQLKQRSLRNSNKRKFTRIYTFDSINICKKTFLNTLGISQKPVDIALDKKRNRDLITDKRGIKSGGRNKVSEDRINIVITFINRLPKYKSHYCRDNTNSKYLAPHLNLNKIYELYCSETENSLSKALFKNIFYTKFNLRFKKPQKDTCVRCDIFNARKKNATGQELQDLIAEHDAHLGRASELRNRMKEDLRLAQVDPSIETLTFDLEKTNCLPRLPSNIIYYKRQLNIYNFGIHQGSSNKGFFNIWLEHEGGRGTQEVGSCLKKFIRENVKDATTHLILWADSCGGQNKSIKLVAMLMHELINHDYLEKITFRFLQPGHTYLPNDSELECALKTNYRLYTEQDYINVMKDCRRKNKFTVNRIQKEDFLSVDLLMKSITNRKIDVNKKKVSWLSTCEIEIRKDNPYKMFFKSNINAADVQIVDIAKKGKTKEPTEFKNVRLPELWPNGKALSDAKLKDLKEIVKMKLIPDDAIDFYSFLEDIRSANFEDDIDGFGESIDFTIIEENNVDEY